ncbi:uncharacterized protein LOC8289507 [Ricinus communis]|uniref:uncharacterized protein LOC8289507 n=1 Tax=Ricinus communis TaxID=3988 RepID=UPI00201A4673|nr:uncharacterized protein LOC8289507 [Ricinus communis]
MSDTVTPSSTEWFHPFYDQTIHGQVVSSSSCFGFGFSSDSTMVTATTTSSSCASDNLLSSPSCSTTANGGQLTPKGVVSKPIRRRSRASKKTPITLLNANTSNFRTLVQQFTGCSSRPTSFGNQKGPINLNFRLGSVQNHNSIETTAMAPYSNSCSYNEYYQMQQQGQQHHHLQLEHQQQQYTVPFEDVYNLPSAAGDDNETAAASRSILEMADEHFMDDFSLHELAKEAFFDEDVNDEYF